MKKKRNSGNTRHLLKKLLSPKLWRKITSVLLAVTVFLTSYMMILPALTIDLDTVVNEPGIDVATADSNLDLPVSDDSGGLPASAGELQTDLNEELSGSAEGALSGSSAYFTEELQSDSAIPAENIDLGYPDETIQGDIDITTPDDADTFLPSEESEAVPFEGEIAPEYDITENEEIPDLEITEDNASPEMFDDSLNIPEEFGGELTEASDENPEDVTDSLPADEQESIDDLTEPAEFFIDDAEASENAAEETEAEENAAEESVLAAHVLKAEGEDYRVTVSFGDEAEIPEGAELLVTEILSDESGYEQYINEASEALSTEKRIMSVDSARFFDITILKDNEPVEPKAPVIVLVELADSFAAEESAAVIHYTEDEVKVVETVDSEEAAASIEEAEAADAAAAEAASDSEEMIIPDSDAEMVNDSIESVETDVPDLAEGYEGIEEEAISGMEEDPFVGSELLADVEEEPFVGSEPLADMEEDPFAGVEPEADMEELPFVGAKPIEAEETDEAYAFTDSMNPIAFVTDSFSVYGFVTAKIEKTILASDGHNYKVSVTCGADAGIPEGADLSVEEITQDTPEYDAYMADLENVFGKGEKRIEYVRLFDIKIVDALDETVKYQPAEGSAVDVRIEFADAMNKDLSVVHFGEDEPEGVVLDAGTDEGEEGSAVEFQTDGFSVFAVAYTVDFHWEVNGKKFEFAIPGGGFVSFTDLVEVLGIADDTNNGENSVENGSPALSLDNVAVSEATREFVADVASLEFSNPELVDVSKVKSDTTVGGIKESRGLECRYSAELKEEQINRINNSAVGNGDWALISMQPFASEETLTVTMKNEEQFVIKVTDAQIHTYVISDSGDTYKITVTYDDKTGIPADAELRARLLTPEDERYQEDIERSNAALLARYDHEAINPLVFEIKIFADDKEIEPLDGTQVNVEISLAMDIVSGQTQDEGGDVEAEAADVTEDEESDEDSLDNKAEEGSMLLDGVEYIIEPTEVDLSDTKVIHMTDDGKTEVIEDLNSMVDTDHNVVVTFETGSFSDYMLQGVYNNNGLNGLPDVIYVGDEIYLQGSGNIWVTGIGSVVSETKYDGDDYKSVRATNPGTFRLCHSNNWNNGATGYTNQYPGKYITVLPARSEGNNGQPYAGTTPPATIPTVSNASIGLTLNLFDYDLDEYLDNRFNNKDYGDHLENFKNRGINSGHSLKFWGSGITDSSYGAQNNYVEHGVTSIVNSNLSGGYPTLRSDNTSLDYLFTPSDGTDKEAYLNVDGLFKKDGDYYVYDSNQNYAWYNPNTNKFEVYNSTYQQKSRGKGGEQATELEDKKIGFFPFHEWDDQYDLYVNWNKNLNHHFGLSMSVPFSLPKDPKAVVDTNNQPIIFDFSGDDDLWVFIDGKLAMDIGGIHQPTSGTINFQNQTVMVNGNPQSFDFSGLYDGELHTLQVFYIERGGCDSNCMIKFNLTQYGDVDFDKVDYENTSDKLSGAVFGIYKDAACTQPLMENLKNGTSRVYVAESNADGHVKFSDIPLGDYYLKEIKAPDGYPLDTTVHPVRVYLEENSLINVKVTIDGIDDVNPGVQITNKKPDPITLGLKKEWKDQNDNILPAPENTSAIFELKRIRNYERITEETSIEGHDVQSSHLVVGWYHNGSYHVHKEYDLVAGSQATVSWSYVDGYTGSKDCYENGTLIDKNEANTVISEALTMPAAGGTATLYIVDESDGGDAIKNINVAGEQFYGNSGGGVIHKFETITEPDPDFRYSEDSNVVNNRITLPIDGTSPWEYEFVNLPLVGRTPNTSTTYSYSYYLEEVSSVSPEGTTVIYKDSEGNVLNAAEDAETNLNGTQTITNQVDLGALELTKNITVTDANGQTLSMTEPNPWVNGTVSFTIDGVDAEGSFTKGIHHDVEITYAAGKITGYKIDNTQTTVNPAVTGTTYSVLVNNLVPGDYVITETGSSNMTLTGITGGKNDADLTEKTVTVTVTHGKNTADSLDATAKAAFTNNLETINVSATKTWADLNNNTTHPTIYFRLFCESEDGDEAVGGVKLKPLPNGTTTVTWENVPKYDQKGDEYVYLVKEYIQKNGGEFTEDGVSYTEAAPNGYVATEEGLSVTNTESDKYDPRTSYTGRKVWVDTNNGATRPGNLTVTLMIDKTGNGPTNDDVVAAHDGTPYTPVWNKPEGSNEWTYMFNNLPVYDSDWNIIHYYAVETPVDGYTQGTPDITNTQYAYTNRYDAQHIPNDADVTISSEINLLPFMAIETVENAYGYKYHVWTVRVATDAEKAELVRIFNTERRVNNITLANTRFVSGLPVSKTADGNVEFLYRSNRYKISISKTSGDVLKVTVDGSRYMTDMIVGTLEYDYSAGSTDLQNTLKTEDYDIQKTWGSGQNPPEGAEVQFTLTATVPGTVTDENPNPDPVIIADLTTLGIAKPVITLNGGQKEGEAYTGDDTTDDPWVYKCENLPQYDKNGKKITYSASETSYTIDGETVDITSEGLVPPTTSGGIYELITTNRIPTENISAHKYWPEGQIVPEGTYVKLEITAKLENGTVPNGVTITPTDVTLDGKVTAGDENEVETVETLWQYTWINLPKFDKDGKKITYTVAEIEYKIGDISYDDLLAAANEPAHDGVDFSFTNELPGTRITVEKTWSNNGSAWPDGVSVIMTLKGSAPIGENGRQTELETLILPDIKEGEETIPQTAEYALSGNETSHIWYNLPMYTLTGKPITYTVDETGMTYSQPGKEPVPIQNWKQAFTVNKETDAENNKITIDNTPLETEIHLTKVWTLNGQPKSMRDGDAIEFKFYRTDAEGELSLSSDGYSADKGTSTLNKILYVGSGSNPGWQTVTISKLPKYVLKLEETDEGTNAYYTGVAYYAVETNVTGNTRISYTLSPMNTGSDSGNEGEEGDESGDNIDNSNSTETTDPTQSAVGTGTITIFNRDTDVDITVDKVDANDTDKKLPKAEFQIMKWKEAGESGVYAAYNLETKDYAAEGEGEKSKLTTGRGEDDYGKLIFEGLLDGKYKIVETKTPDGYLKLDISDIFFRIDDGTVIWTDENGNEIDPEDKPNHVAYDDLTFTVENTPGAGLPNTGGRGTMVFYLLGIILTGFAGTGLVMQKRRKVG